MMQKHPTFFLNAFYEAKFADSFFVVKASGDVVENDEALDGLIKDIKSLILQGIRVLLVYGAGGTTDRVLKERGLPIVKHDGRRVTDEKTLNILQEVLGAHLSLRIHRAMSKTGLQGLSFNAVPSSWMDVELRPKTPIDFGFVGDVVRVNGRAVRRTFKASQFVACACLAATNDGVSVNINADTIASDLAIGARADKLLLLSNVDGVKVEGKRAFIITDDQIPNLIKTGQVSDGMRVKMDNCARVLDGGVGRVHIINGMKAGTLSQEIFESVGPGTMVLKACEKQKYLREVEIHKQIKEKADA